MKTVYISREAFNELLLKGLHPSFDDAFWESIRRSTSWNGSVQEVSLVQVSFRQIEIRDRGIGEHNHSIRIRVKRSSSSKSPPPTLVPGIKRAASGKI